MSAGGGDVFLCAVLRALAARAKENTLAPVPFCRAITHFNAMEANTVMLYHPA